MKPKGVIKKLRNSKLLTVQDYERIRGDHMGLGQNIADYSRRDYPDRLRDYLGVDIKTSYFEELNQEIEKVSKEEAEKIAGMWISEAKEVRRGVKRNDVIRAAKLYLALRELIEKYNADAITMASWQISTEWEGEPKLNIMPPLSWLELSKKNIPCCCQGLIDCLVTQLIGTYVTDGYQGFTGDILNDWIDWDSLLTSSDFGDAVIIGHCGAPIAPHGDDRIPYKIRDHIINEDGPPSSYGRKETPTATTVDWPSDEVATIVKFDVYNRRVLVGTGTVLDGDSLYENFADIACRNKMVIKIDEPEFYSFFSGDLEEFRGSWGNHLVVFYGNLRKNIKDLANLTKINVVER